MCSLFTVPTWPALRTQQDIVVASLDISFYHPNRPLDAALQDYAAASCCPSSCMPEVGTVDFK
jgi:hypothetical protein